MSEIIRLPQHTINRIAAGEVIERPASVVKELVENSLDAGAKKISVRIENGGLSRIIVEDDGKGMNEADLSLCVERHATSKLKPNQDNEWDLLRINSLGFRGEALPSIGSIARLSIMTKMADEHHSICLTVDAGLLSPLSPAPVFSAHGTRIEVSNLFYATPARLKFLKSEKSESLAISEEIKRQAMAHCDVSFELVSEKRTVLRLKAYADDDEGRLQRLGDVLGEEFSQNAILINQQRENVRLYGYAGLPTYSRGNSSHQFLYVNGRTVRDKLLAGALRAAYADFLARDRHCVVALYIETLAEEVDVNVHPAKAEVRFREPNLVRGLLISGLRHSLSHFAHRTATTPSQQLLHALKQDHIQQLTPQAPVSQSAHLSLRTQEFNSYAPLARTFSQPASYVPMIQDMVANDQEGELGEINGRQYTHQTLERQESVPQENDFPLGAAVAQLHQTYIISQTKDGFILVDQHAAHERLVYEKIKHSQKAGKLEQQGLLIPEIIDLDETAHSALCAEITILSELGLKLEPFGPSSVIAREIPSVLARENIRKLIIDLADHIVAEGHSAWFKEQLAEIFADFACRHSVRAGRKLNIVEMNALLRTMEETPHSGQCNHGRPTYVTLKLSDIEKLFGRR